MRDTRGAEPGWLVEGMIPRGLPTLLFGAGASGKGYLAVALAVHVAAGGAFLGRATKQGGVLYADWEADDATFRRRRCGWRLASASAMFRRAFTTAGSTSRSRT